MPDPDHNLQIVPEPSSDDFFETGNRTKEAKTVVHHQRQYSFADDLKRQSAKDKDDPPKAPRNPGFNYKGSQFFDDEFSAVSTDR